MVHNNSALWLVAAAGTLAPYWKKGRITEQVQNENRRKSWTIICPVHPGYRPHCMLCAQRRSAQERACTRGGGTKRVFFFYNVNRNKLRIQGSKNWEKTWRNLSANYWQQVLYMKGPTLWQPFERKISFPFVFVCLFVFICHPHFSFSPSYLLFSCYPHFFLSSGIFPSAGMRAVRVLQTLPDCMELLSLVKQRQQQQAQGWTRTRKNGTLIIYFFVSSLFVS